MFDYFRKRASNPPNVCCEDSLTFTQGHKCISKLNTFSTCTITVTSWTKLSNGIQTWHAAHAHFDDLDHVNVWKAL